MAYGRERYDRDPYDRDRFDRERPGRERGVIDRTSDEVRSWFGDDEARLRRERDERESERHRDDEDRWRRRTYIGERNYSSERPYGDRSQEWMTRAEPTRNESFRSEGYRDYGDRYGRTYGSSMDREREFERGPMFQPYARGSQEFGRETYGSGTGFGASRGLVREWRSSESWRVPGPHAGRGPKGYQRSDERIREELNDRLTAHGLIDATEIEVRIQGGEATLTGFVDSRDAKRAAEDVAEDVPGVREVNNQLRIRSHADDTGVGRTSVLGLTEHETQTAETARADQASRSRARNT